MKRFTYVLGVFVVGLLLVQQPAQAQSFAQIGYATFTTDVTITTTTEKVLVSSGPVTCPRQTCNIVVMGWAQVTTGTNTTGLTPLFRRGTAIGNTALGEANVEQVKSAAGNTEPVFFFAQEDRVDVATVEYSFTVKQTAASADGTALQGGIIVLVR